MSACLYSGCQNKQISASDNFVEVKTVLPNSTNFRKLKGKLLIGWKRNGEAKFHRDCWETLAKASRSRKQHQHLPRMCHEEKCLVKEAAKTVEFFDSQDSLKRSAAICASLIKESTHCTAFTGAGISTSAGIGDYRGKSGKWTQQDQDTLNMDAVIGAVGGSETSEEKPAVKDDEDSDSEMDVDEPDGVSYESLRPTYTHEALKKLMEKGYLKYVISQNCDGLHGLSGVPADKISELHGNVFVEICEKCATRYERPYYVMDDSASEYYVNLEDYGKSSLKKPINAKQCELCGLSHRTGRRCEQKHCRGFLKDSIINFCDNLEDEILDRAIDNAKLSDMMICLGSTLTVTPANSLVEMTKKPYTLAICNRQTTHMDDSCGGGVRVFGDCDDFMREVMKGVLGADELCEWEEGRQKRLADYAEMRKT